MNQKTSILFLLALSLVFASFSQTEKAPQDSTKKTRERSPDTRRGLRFTIGLAATASYTPGIDFAEIKSRTSLAENQHAPHTQIKSGPTFPAGISVFGGMGVHVSNRVGLDLELSGRQLNASYRFHEKYEDPIIQYDYKRAQTETHEWLVAEALLLLRIHTQGKTYFRIGGGISTPIQLIASTRERLTEYANGNLLAQNESIQRKQIESFYPDINWGALDYFPVAACEIGLGLTKKLQVHMGLQAIFNGSLADMNTHVISGSVGVSAFLGR